MCSSLCSVLKQRMNAEEASRLSVYLTGLTPNASQCITISKASNAMGISLEKTYEILMAAAAEKILRVEYALRCPECGMLIQRFHSLDEIPQEMQMCYGCESNFYAAAEIIEVMFCYDHNGFFQIGQSEGEIIPSKQIVQIDTLMGLFQTGLNLNNLFYAPTDEEYADLREKLAALETPKISTKQKGDAMESLFLSLLCCVKVFRASSIKTENNQIDCYVRNQVGSCLPHLGQRIVVECKNEKKKPDNTYYYKLSGIIDGINGNAKEIVKLGIIVSYKSPAKTIKNLAVLRYARDGLVMISIDINDLKKLIINHVNLLEMIERKRDEITTNVVSDLQKVGIFSA